MLTEAQQSSLAGRIVRLIRWIAVRGIAAVTAGVLVLGLGGRLVMLASRLIHPDSIGRITENGNRIGEFTVEGTIGLIIFGGIFSGVLAGLVWVLIKEWIPANATVVGLGAIPLGGLNLIQSENRDFAILGDSRVDILLLILLLFAFGFVPYHVDNWLDEKLPEGYGVTAIVVYSLLVSFGAALTLPLFGSFFSQEFCFCRHPPIWMGIFFAATTLATVTWWFLRLRGAEEPPLWVSVSGRSALALTVLAGGFYLGREILAIV